MKKIPFGKLFLLLLVTVICISYFLYKAERPIYLFGRVVYGHFYLDRLSPVLEVTLDGNPVMFETNKEQWQYQNRIGQWIKLEYNSESEAADKRAAAFVSGAARLEISSDKAPDHAALKIVDMKSGKVALEEQAELAQLPFPGTNGKYLYELELSWTDESRPYRGKAALTIPVEIEYPEKFVFSQEKLIQGDMLEVTVYFAENPDDIILEQPIYKEFRWYQQEGFIRGYIPTNYSVEPGQYRIKYGNRKKGTEFIQEIEVVAHNYRIQHLTVDKQKEEETRNETAYAEFAKYFTPVRKQSAASRYFTEPFIMPVQGRLTTEFGQMRYVNGAPSSSRHSGLDIAAPTGTEVKAANSGKVVLARMLILTGNTVVIDHGEGLFSVYYHLNEISVKTGEMAERGQQIGKVGSTGFSTGPHLHFTMSYYDMNIEPGFFVAGEPVTYDNYRRVLQD